MSPKLQEKLLKQFNQIQASITMIDVEHCSQKTALKLAQFTRAPKQLEQHWEGLGHLNALLKDYLSGEYGNISWEKITTISTCLTYFVSSVDSIPDFIPTLGYTDDAFVIEHTLKSVAQDLTDHQKWAKHKP